MYAIVPRSPLRRRRLNAASKEWVEGVADLSTTAALREAATLKILVVDDCPIQQLLSSAILARWGIKADLASDGVEAVLLTGEKRFDLVLMDIQMDVLDGVAATTRIRRNERRSGARPVPVIAYTAEPISASIHAWADAGINAALAKPCQAEDMGRCLQYWCGVDPQPSESRRSV